MHDFSCKDADDIHYEELKKSVRHFKEEGGRGIVCKAVEEYGREQARESAFNTKIENIKSIMVNLKLTVEQAMQAMNISQEEQAAIMARLKG